MNMDIRKQETATPEPDTQPSYSNGANVGLPVSEVALGASSSICEKSFSMSRNISTDHRHAMLHCWKSQLVVS